MRERRRIILRKIYSFLSRISLARKKKFSYAARGKNSITIIKVHHHPAEKEQHTGARASNLRRSKNTSNRVTREKFAYKIRPKISFRSLALRLGKNRYNEDWWSLALYSSLEKEKERNEENFVEGNFECVEASGPVSHVWCVWLQERINVLLRRLLLPSRSINHSRDETEKTSRHGEESLTGSWKKW